LVVVYMVNGLSGLSVKILGAGVALWQNGNHLSRLDIFETRGMRMGKIGTFPFGQPILKVEQKNRAQKQVFVLGVYASAVHARWIGPDGKQLISALGVASEPEIFWRGDGVDEIVDSIDIPEGAGRLVPASPNLNGPSGQALDDCYLKPLGLGREDVWLCDLVPYSCMNGGQARALIRAYEPRATKLGLPEFCWNPVPVTLADDDRRTQIEGEIAETRPEILITLGDQPLKWFSRFHGSKSTLAGYGTDEMMYGRIHRIRINGQELGLLPLVHPRQAGRLGRFSVRWAALHEKWAAGKAAEMPIEREQ
ncbi:MAG: hypothetical protein ABIF77_08880, partial [bacterium]